MLAVNTGKSGSIIRLKASNMRMDLSFMGPGVHTILRILCKENMKISCLDQSIENMGTQEHIARSPSPEPWKEPT